LLAIVDSKQSAININYAMVVLLMDFMNKMMYLTYSMRIALWTVILLIWVGVSETSAQTVFQPKPIEQNFKGVVYDFETLYEGRIHTQGFAIGFKKGKLKTYDRTTYQNFEFGYIKDQREQRTNRNLVIGGERISSPFIFGKANELFTFRYSYGVKRFLSEKTRRRGLAVALIYEGGATLGILKPYSVQVIRTEPDDPTQQFLETITFSEEVRDQFLDERILYGGASFFDGLGSITPSVGLHGKVGMQWALGAFDQKEKAFETGVMLDVFPRKIPLLIEQEGISNSFYFAKLYISFVFGTRKRIGEE